MLVALAQQGHQRQMRTQKNIYLYIWWKARNVSSIVWCLENRDGAERPMSLHDKAVHEEVFPYVRTPQKTRHKATPPRDWKQIYIRETWLHNLKSY